MARKDKGWRELLVEGEKHPTLKGRILFLLPEKENTDKETYRRYLEIARLIIPQGEGKYLWMRAILAQIERFEITDLTLKNVNEGWKRNLNSILMEPMQSLLSRLADSVCAKGGIPDERILTDEMQKICSQYEVKEGLEWIYPLVNWEDGNCTLFDKEISENKRIKKGDNDDNNVYLCHRKNLQYTNCILLTGSRDRIISEIIPKAGNDFDRNYSSYDCSVHDRFFYGKEVRLRRHDIEIPSLGPVTGYYVFEPEKITAGVRYDENQDLFGTDSDG